MNMSLADSMDCGLAELPSEWGLLLTGLLRDCGLLLNDCGLLLSDCGLLCELNDK